MSSNKKIGNKGEKIAEDFLVKKGYKIVDRNFYIQGGEIDFIAEKNNMIVFVEVKTRRSKKFGEIIEQISKRKMELLIHTSEVYLSKNDLLNKDYRIDVITVFLNSFGKLKAPFFFC